MIAQAWLVDLRKRLIAEQPELSHTAPVTEGEVSCILVKDEDGVVMKITVEPESLVAFDIIKASQRR